VAGREAVAYLAGRGFGRRVPARVPLAMRFVVSCPRRRNGLAGIRLPAVPEPAAA